MVTRSGTLRPARWWLLAYLVLAGLDLVAEGVHARVPAFVGSLLAMPLLIGFLRASARRNDRLHRLVTVALVLSWLGDWLGDLISPMVLVKIGLFFIGHLFYIRAFWPFRRRSILHRRPVVAAYVVVIAALIAWIAPRSGAVAVPVAVYGLVLATMAVLSTGVHRLAGLGGALFVISDLSIATTTFVLPGSFLHAELVIMGTYLPAQLLIVLGVRRADRPPGSGDALVEPDRVLPDLAPVIPIEQHHDPEPGVDHPSRLSMRVGLPGRQRRLWARTSSAPSGWWSGPLPGLVGVRTCRRHR